MVKSHRTQYVKLIAQRARLILWVALDFFYPPTCLACPASVQKHDLLCAQCWWQMPFITRPFCDRLGIPLPVDYGGPLRSMRAMVDPPVFNQARSAALYDGIARDLVHRLKYSDKVELVEPMAQWMARAGEDFFHDRPLMVPVPMHWWRFLWRRFNQAALLAAKIGQLKDVEVLFHALRRVRRTRPQPGLTKAERADNLKDAFRVDGPEAVHIRGRHIVLVDDVLTSGATANACARVLLKAGAKSVDLLCFACVARAT
jgi:ComF family protein